jgi:hypothetical protein
LLLYLYLCLCLLFPLNFYSLCLFFLPNILTKKDKKKYKQKKNLKYSLQ